MTPDQIEDLEDEAVELRLQWEAYKDKARRAYKEWRAALDELKYQRDLRRAARAAGKL